MKIGIIQQLLDVFEEAFKKLHVNISLQDLEYLTITIHKTMSADARHFHTPEHVLHLANSFNPIQSLAALFHDIVYYQVDRGFSAEVYSCISPFIQEKEDEIYLVDTVISPDRPFTLTLEVFGFSLGQKLSFYEGLNEFLSALVMAKKLGSIIPEKELLKIIVYIEATIPFRGKNNNGEGPFEILAARLRKINEAYRVSMTEPEIEDVIRGAVLFSNKDVDSFAGKDPDVFLDGTWKLLPETNVALRSGKIYSIIDYRKALQKMEGFLGLLKPENIIHNYKGCPPEEEYQEMVRLARKNIHTAREYLGIKLLSMAILEALAELSGGDAPLSLYMGDTQRGGEDVKRLENYLPLEKTSDLVKLSPEVYKLLEAGRASESDFDMKNSPLSLFLYNRLGTEGVKRLLDEAQAMFKGNSNAQEFLAKIEAPIISEIAQACAEMVPTRREILLQYANELGSHS
jgi:hypothetical protein